MPAQLRVPQAGNDLYKALVGEWLTLFSVGRSFVVGNSVGDLARFDLRKGG